MTIVVDPRHIFVDQSALLVNLVDFMTFLVDDGNALAFLHDSLQTERHGFLLGDVAQHLYHACFIDSLGLDDICKANSRGIHIEFAVNGYIEVLGFINHTIADYKHEVAVFLPHLEYLATEQIGTAYTLQDQLAIRLAINASEVVIAACPDVIV